MTEKRIIGYCDAFSVAPGQTVRFMVSSEVPGDYRADLVHLRSGDDSPGAPGVMEDPVAAPFDGSYPAEKQAIRTGSCLAIDQGPPLPDLTAFTIAAWIWPTRPGGARQTILGMGAADPDTDIQFCIDAVGALALRIGGCSISTGAAMTSRIWYQVSASVDLVAGTVSLHQKPLDLSPGQRMAHRDAEVVGTIGARARLEPGAARLAIAALPVPEGHSDHFNGKIERPRLAARSLDAVHTRHLLDQDPDGALGDDLLGHWAFCEGIDTQDVPDQGPHGRYGRLINLPTRGVTGRIWTGETQDWRQIPGHYDAIHFHDDDLYDAGWKSDFSFTVPDGMKSGLYAARVGQGDDVDRIPFVVRPPLGTATAPLAFLMPTASYMAYANYRLRLKANPIFGDGRPTNEGDAYLATHPELGNSTYDLHSDRSGVAFASRLRPVTNMKPGQNRPWGFPADCNILAWLDHIGQDFDVITDEDLHAHGVELLRPYRAVMTGSHPEYHSTAMLDGIERYLSGGGRLIYMGGNGFYWRVAFHPDLPGVLEVRRAEDGTRAWIAEPGEYHHAFNGEYGGLWRRIGRAPNRLVGVGFAAQGFEKSGYYRRTAAADNPRAAFILDGIADDILGDFGTIGGGAAGEEIDRCDARLGSPAHALVVATSEGLGPDMLRTKEEFLSTIPPFDDPKVRADLTFFECPNGGAVFSTGSIAYAASLSHNGWDNNIARLTGNVVRRFIDPTPFPMPEGSD